jgi:GNAT superfamily N-acetyltransferase
LAEFTATLHHGPGPHPSGSPQSVHGGGAEPPRRPRPPADQLPLDLEGETPDDAAPEDGNSEKWQAWLKKVTKKVTIGESQDVRRTLSEMLPRATIKDLYDAYTVNDINGSGLRSTIAMIQTSLTGESSITIWGIIVTKTGERVGDFSRTLKYGDAHHSFFVMDKSWQGQGFGSKFYRASENVYRRIGVGEVHLSANADVGGYAWARLGFDFVDGAGSREARLITEEAQVIWNREERNRSTYTPFPLINHAWELAALTTTSGRRVGKEVMLGSQWRGYKRLSGDSEGVRVGDIYYAEKAKKRKRP